MPFSQQLKNGSIARYPEMMSPAVIIAPFFVLMIFVCSAQSSHLFILSGQSNMALSDPEIAFIPAIHEEYVAENATIVKDALGGQHGDVCEKSPAGLVAQLQSDLGHEGPHVVIGRLSDFDLANETYRDWTRIRQAQVALAEKRPSTKWVDTGDLNDRINQKGDVIKDNLHYSVAGCKEFGERLVRTAID